MPTIYSIKERYRKGDSLRKISRDMHLHRNTVKKYAQMEDLSPGQPVVRKRASKLDPFKKLLERWVREDLKRRVQDRRTAAGMHKTLVAEHGFKGSYLLVQRYVKELKENIQLTSDSRAAGGFVDCRDGWQPGTAQADFGEGTFIVKGREVRLKYFVLSHPYSNVGFTQVFGGETAECAAQGLVDIFEYMGGVPRRIIFDNASGVGHKTKHGFVETELFQTLRHHYGFEVTFTNPYSGNEKGNVERKAAAVRKQLFCPPRIVDDLESFNRQLLEEVKDVNKRIHYHKQLPQSELFEEDLKAFLPLPSKPFTVRRFEERTTDKYGRIELDGCHFYSASPVLQKQRVVVGIGAHTIEIYRKDGTPVTSHPRAFGTKRTKSDDPATVLALAARNPGSWQQGSLRQILSDPLREYLDKAEKSVRRTALRAMRDASADFGFEIASRAVEELALRGTPVSSDNAVILAARLADGSLDLPPMPGPPLEVYDRAFLPSERNES